MRARKLSARERAIRDERIARELVRLDRRDREPGPWRAWAFAMSRNLLARAFRPKGLEA